MNPFNGIESLSLSRAVPGGAMSWNPFNGIESFLTVLFASAMVSFGIHSMELKDSLILEHTVLPASRNPFNGIERPR